MKKSIKLERYSQFVDRYLLDEIYSLASSLTGIHVLHLNTTPNSGGVVEILKSLLLIMQELGVNHTWKVVNLTDSSKRFIYRLWDLLHGDSGVLPKQEQDIYMEELKSLGKIPADVYIVHDFQLAPLAKISPYMHPSIWFCHIDTLSSNAESENYLKQFLKEYDLCAFNTPGSVLKFLPEECVQVINLGIDPFSLKNMALPESEGIDLLTCCGIDMQRPLITQVSRFDKWKNPWQAIDSYRLVKRQIPSVQLALVGAIQPPKSIRPEDTIAGKILDCVRKYAEGDSDIHLLHDASLIQEKHVNAFQRYSNVILQRSIREGFGLTVTEAMWKKQPVVGTCATGLRHQIKHGINGYLVDETEMCANSAIKLIQSRDLFYKLGEQAHTYVKNNALLPVMIRDFLKAISKVA